MLASSISSPLSNGASECQHYLGSGTYFWEADPERAWQWAVDNHKRKKIGHPAVIGAIIDLRSCLNLTTQEGAGLVKRAYESYKTLREVANKPIPKNENPPSLDGPDQLLRRLDNAVVERLHSIIKENGLATFDTVRGMFREGNAIYPGAGFWEKTHVQIAVRNPDCIVGYFRPRVEFKSAK